MIAQLLPAGLATAEAFGDVPGESAFPGEEPLIARAVEKRRREFITARRCARDALSQLGVPPQAILSGPSRQPQWPAGIVGSITHCDGYRAAAVAPVTTVASVGIDGGPHAPLPEGVFDAITVPDERDHVRELVRREPSTCWDRLLFSAKESVFKAWFPLTGLQLGFEEAALTFTEGRFAARLLRSGPRHDGAAPLTGFEGRWRVHRGLVLTAVTVTGGPVSSG
jgi:4'-phosphopantetheinyl transferase EntD